MNPWTIQDLCHKAKEKKPNLVFFIKTKLNSVKCIRVKRRLNCEACFVVEPIGRSGGLALMWDHMTKVEVTNYSQRHINAWITNEQGNISGC